METGAYSIILIRVNSTQKFGSHGGVGRGRGEGEGEGEGGGGDN